MMSVFTIFSTKCLHIVMNSSVFGLVSIHFMKFRMTVENMNERLLNDHIKGNKIILTRRSNRCVQKMRLK